MGMHTVTKPPHLPVVPLHSCDLHIAVLHEEVAHGGALGLFKVVLHTDHSKVVPEGIGDGVGFGRRWWWWQCWWWWWWFHVEQCDGMQQKLWITLMVLR